jgi:hypothetical protein
MIPSEGFRAFSKDDHDDHKKQVELSFWRVWQYQAARKKGNLPVKTTEEAVKIEECILFFGLDFFCVEIYRMPARSPHEDYHIVCWNREYN